MRKSIFTILVAVATVLAFSGTVFATPGQVTLKTDVPNIPKSACYQAGSITMEFDSGTEMREGDVIEFTLNNLVTLCKNINFFMMLAENPVSGTAIVLPVDTTNPVSGSDALDSITITDGAMVAGDDYGFLVYGAAGSQKLTLTLAVRSVADGSVTADKNAGTAVMLYTGNDAASDKLVVRLFDEKDTSNADSVALLAGQSAGSLYKDDPTTGAVVDYISDSDVAVANGQFQYSDNTICIDTLTQDYMDEYVQATPDSMATNWTNTVDRFDLTFSGDYRIAHILSQAAYDLITCKSSAVGHIQLTGGQQAGCDDFDFEDHDGYCTDHSGNTKLIINSQAGPFPKEDFAVTLDILVNGQSGERGVYWAASNVQTAGFETENDACGGFTAANPAVTPGAVAYRGDGTTVVSAFTNAACTVPSERRAVRLVTTAHNLGLNDAVPEQDDYLYIDMPIMNYDASQIQSGDVVSVRVSLSMLPCGSLGLANDTIEVGTFGCDALNSSLLYPYFPAATGTYFWSAFTIANNADVSGGVTLYWYESDGDAFTGVKATNIDAHAVWNSGFISNLITDADWTWTQTSGTGDQGDDMCYIIACTPFASDGFAFIAGSPTGESMGYLPRSSNYSTNAGVIQAVCQ